MSKFGMLEAKIGIELFKYNSKIFSTTMTWKIVKTAIFLSLEIWIVLSRISEVAQSVRSIAPNLLRRTNNRYL